MEMLLTSAIFLEKERNKKMDIVMKPNRLKELLK
jgi:hypothetical protein